MKTIISFLFIFISQIAAGSIDAESAIGSRAFSLGQSATVSYSDILNSINNPASLYYSKSFNTSFFYSEPFNDTQNYSLGFTIPTKNYGTFGFRYFNFTVNNLVERNVNGEKTGLFSFRQNEYVISYGFQLYDKVTFGFNAKWLTENFPDLNTREFQSDHTGIDLSFALFPDFANDILKNMGLGIVLKNLIQANDNNDHLPKGIVVLAENGYKISSHSIFVVMNYMWYEGTLNKYQRRIHFGLEYGYDFTFFRIGYNDDMFSVGTGIHYKYFSINYGYGEYFKNFYGKSSIHNFGLNIEI